MIRHGYINICRNNDYRFYSNSKRENRQMCTQLKATPYKKIDWRKPVNVNPAQDVSRLFGIKRFGSAIRKLARFVRDKSMLHTSVRIDCDGAIGTLDVQSYICGSRKTVPLTCGCHWAATDGNRKVVANRKSNTNRGEAIVVSGGGTCSGSPMLGGCQWLVAWCYLELQQRYINNLHWKNTGFI